MLKIKNILEQAPPPPKERISQQGPQQPESQTQQGPQPLRTGGNQQTTEPTIFDCVKKVHPNASFASNTLVAKITNTKTYSFFSNNRFLYKDGTALLKGTWSCDGGDNYNVKLDNGQTYSSKNKVWSEKPTTTPEPERPQQQTNTQQQTQTSTPAQSGTNRATVIQRGKNNLKIAGSDAIIY